ncbi:MAG: bifunctional diaminohydroxyphosphoribosylaminopyrimidine deaminase/5-amino-6-(5-phosphoribosylamino)uracil reductase RibD [Campylobacterota bacterium]|nr:bifunctional diaminohydroxyphosphoribosylaminopyrimidine deaminase/5-amino-6-(5-phosphoribosylamino)uracil reductase RibD [Campylobacterota bacterium]
MQSAYYLKLALDKAWSYQGLTFPNPAVGACVVGKNGEILAVNAHQKAGEAHAEVLALRDAYVLLTDDKAIAFTCKAHELHEYLLKNHQDIFQNCSIYVTLEPCSHEGKTPSCASLIAALGLKKVFIGHRDENPCASGGTSLLQEADTAIEINSDVENTYSLLYPFLQWQKHSFVTFKWAQRLDGTIDGGTVSSKASREYVHAMRNVCDLLVIGGNTVRLDRPTLDSRMVKGKAPDILIYSHQDDFDRDIPLFQIDGRQVYIENSLERMKDYKNILIEGGRGMYEATKDVTDYYLTFISPQSGSGTMSLLNNKDDFHILHVRQIESDMMLWMKRN